MSVYLKSYKIFCTFISGIHTLLGDHSVCEQLKIVVEVWGNKLWSQNKGCEFFLWKELNLVQCLISTVH